MENVRFSLAICAVLAGTTAAPAQVTNDVQPEPFFQVMTTIPGALPTAEGTADIELSYFIDSSGDISSVSLMSVAGVRASGVCEPICFKVGNPPRQMCLISGGCGGGGGGSGGTLSTEPVLIDFELAVDPARNAEGVFDFRINVIPAGDAGVAAALESTVTLPVE
jgi:hypothetical protein